MLTEVTSTSGKKEKEKNSRNLKHQRKVNSKIRFYKKNINLKNGLQHLLFSLMLILSTSGNKNDVTSSATISSLCSCVRLNKKDQGEVSHYHISRQFARCQKNINGIH